MGYFYICNFILTAQVRVLQFLYLIQDIKIGHKQSNALASIEYRVTLFVSLFMSLEFIIQVEFSRYLSIGRVIIPHDGAWTTIFNFYK